MNKFIAEEKFRDAWKNIALIVLVVLLGSQFWVAKNYKEVTDTLVYEEVEEIMGIMEVIVKEIELYEKKGVAMELDYDYDWPLDYRADDLKSIYKIESFEFSWYEITKFLFYKVQKFSGKTDLTLNNKAFLINLKLYFKDMLRVYDNQNVGIRTFAKDYRVIVTKFDEISHGENHKGLSRYWK